MPLVSPNELSGSVGTWYQTRVKAGGTPLPPAAEVGTRAYVQLWEEYVVTISGGEISFLTAFQAHDHLEELGVPAGNQDEVQGLFDAMSVAYTEPREPEPGLPLKFYKGCPVLLADSGPRVRQRLFFADWHVRAPELQFVVTVERLWWNAIRRLPDAMDMLLQTLEHEYKEAVRAYERAVDMRPFATPYEIARLMYQLEGLAHQDVVLLGPSTVEGYATEEEYERDLRLHVEAVGLGNLATRDGWLLPPGALERSYADAL